MGTDDLEPGILQTSDFSVKQEGVEERLGRDFCACIGLQYLGSKDRYYRLKTLVCTL